MRQKRALYIIVIWFVDTVTSLWLSSSCVHNSFTYNIIFVLCASLFSVDHHSVRIVLKRGAGTGWLRTVGYLAGSHRVHRARGSGSCCSAGWARGSCRTLPGAGCNQMSPVRSWHWPTWCRPWRRSRPARKKHTNVIMERVFRMKRDRDRWIRARADESRERDWLNCAREDAWFLARRERRRPWRDETFFLPIWNRGFFVPIHECANVSEKHYNESEWYCLLWEWNSQMRFVLNCTIIVE